MTSPYAEAEVLIRSEDPDKVNEGLERLRLYAETHSEDAVAWFQYGGGLDFLDHEAKAMVAYERVFALGVEELDADDRPRIYVQAGSTLRNLGRFDEARSLLAEGRGRYPDFRALAVFQALVDVSAGRDRAAIDHLFEALLAIDEGDDSVASYRRALTYYANEIRES